LPQGRISANFEFGKQGKKPVPSGKSGPLLGGQSPVEVSKRRASGFVRSGQRPRNRTVQGTGFDRCL